MLYRFELGKFHSIYYIISGTYKNHFLVDDGGDGRAVNEVDANETF